MRKKNPTQRKIQRAISQHKNATKIFDKTMIADRLRAVIWNNNSHPTGVVKPVNTESSNLPQQLFNQIDTDLNNCK